MTNIANYFCNTCGTLLKQDLCSRCNKDVNYIELQIIENEEKLKTESRHITKRSQIIKQVEEKPKKDTSTIKAEEPINDNKPSNTFNNPAEDPYMILVNSSRLNICPSKDVLNKLKNFHFYNNDEKLLKEIGNEVVKMKDSYLHLIKAGFLITVFKTCNNENCKFSLPKFEISCPGHKFVKIPKWLVNE